jgi:hypothetical protein
LRWVLLCQRTLYEETNTGLFKSRGTLFLDPLFSLFAQGEQRKKREKMFVGTPHTPAEALSLSALPTFK